MNLLTDPILSADGAGAVTLPGLFAASARGEVNGFPRLRAHQRAAWHMFRVQLAALALDHANLVAPPEDEETWKRLLCALTEGGTDPWALIGDNRNTPAFLQPPDPGGLKWDAIRTPDALDLLITSRNHDVKAAVAGRAEPEDWVYALISLQTSEGYGGRGNFGIARMNGGSSSRVMLGLAPIGPGGGPDPAAWWRRDLALLLRNPGNFVTLTKGGPALLWCLPWPEGEQLPVARMDPWSIEVCRRVRLRLAHGEIRAERATSKASRVAAKAFAGVVDDPWAPVSIKEATPKTLTLGEGRFDYRRMVALLTLGDWRQPLAARLDIPAGEVAGDMVVVAEALSRGNSKTDGFQSRTIPFPARVRRARNLPDLISTVSEVQMSEIKNADAALREAIALYAADGEPGKVGKPHRQRASPVRARFDAVVDRIFFEHLWARVEARDAGLEAEAAASRAFRTALAETVRSELVRAFEMMPCSAIRAPRARVRAQGRLEGLLRKYELVEAYQDVR